MMESYQQVEGEEEMEEMHEQLPVLDAEEEPIIVTMVDYCLLCGQIAVLYDLEGKVIKREMVDESNTMTYQDLFDCLCVNLGMRKNSKLKKDWDFCQGPFPFCVECEQLMQNLIEICKQVDGLKSKIKKRITEAEDKYVREGLYENQDHRYLNFRKSALGENFKGDVLMSRERRMSRRSSMNQQSNIKIESTKSIVKPEETEKNSSSTSITTLPEGSTEAESSFSNIISSRDLELSTSQPTLIELEPPSSQEASARKSKLSILKVFSHEPEPSASASKTAYSTAATSPVFKTRGSVKEIVASTSSSPNDTKPLSVSSGAKKLNRYESEPTPQVRRSLRVRNRSIKYREESPPPLDNKLGAMVCVENFNTGITSEPVLVLDDLKPPAGDSETTRGGSRRGRKRKRQSDVNATVAFEIGLVGNDKNARSLRDVKPTYDMDWSASGEKKKRGRRKGSSYKHAAGIKRELDQRPRKRYAERKLKVDVDVKNGEEDTELFCGGNDAYKVAPLIKDPLSGNIYYRNIQFVWIKEAHSFQCSTCCSFIPHGMEYALKERFHKHYTKVHSDRFMCRLCPGWNRFQNDLELHNHFRSCHPGYWHIEPPQIQRRPRVAASVPTASNARKVSEPRKSKNFRPKPCTICHKPINTRDERVVEEHHLSHMNAKEIATFLKNKERFDKTRKYSKEMGRKVLSQFTSKGKRSIGNCGLKVEASPPSQSRTCAVCGENCFRHSDFKKHKMTHMGKMEIDEFLKMHDTKVFRKRTYKRSRNAL